jgi:Beta-propeller repeat
MSKAVLRASSVYSILKSGLFLYLATLLISCGGGNESSPTATYTIGGTVSGLTSGSLVLKNNDGDTLTVSANSTAFTFTTGLANSATYAVTVGTQPSGLTCSVTNGGGTVASANVINVVVACAPSWTGIKQMGVAGKNTFGYSVATDASGNVYIAGDTDGGLGGNTLTGVYDFYVTKYNSSGVLQYTKQMGVAGAATSGYSVATDASGNVYVAGSTNGGLGGNTLTGTTDFYVAKYNSSGDLQYTKQMGVAGAETYGWSVATDASGNVYVAGYTTGGLGGNTLTGLYDFFVTKYDSSGVLQYSKQMGVTGAETSGFSVATDASGNVYVTGDTDGGLGGNTLTGVYDFYVTKYNSSGDLQYTKQMGVTGAETSGNSVATDASGNVYMAGSTNGGLGGNTLTGLYDFFVTKYNSSGVLQ